MIETLIPCCRECLAPIEQKDRCLCCGARWPHLSESEIKAHNRVSFALFWLFVVITLSIGWVATVVANAS